MMKCVPTEKKLKQEYQKSVYYTDTHTHTLNGSQKEKIENNTLIFIIDDKADAWRLRRGDKKYYGLSVVYVGREGAISLVEVMEA